jgi:hypothetical protein
MKASVSTRAKDKRQTMLDFAFILQNAIALSGICQIAAPSWIHHLAFGLGMMMLNSCD